jgi:hypothetical protein
MTFWTRFWIGGGGALLPLLVTLLAVDLGPLIDGASQFSLGTYVGAAIRYLVLFTLGGIVAALNSDEVQPIKLVQLGIAAPALIATYVNAQSPKPPAVQTAAVHARMLSLNVISSVQAAQAGVGGDGRIVVAEFLTDLLRSATAPLQRTAPPAQNQADVDRAIANARSSAASATAAAAKAAADAAKLDHQSTPEAISSVQRSADDARTAAQKAQSDVKALGEVTRSGATR